jgi:hypothetical protein
MSDSSPSRPLLPYGHRRLCSIRFVNTTALLSASAVRRALEFLHGAVLYLDVGEWPWPRQPRRQPARTRLKRLILGVVSGPGRNGLRRSPGRRKRCAGSREERQAQQKTAKMLGLTAAGEQLLLQHAGTETLAVAEAAERTALVAALDNDRQVLRAEILTATGTAAKPAKTDPGKEITALAKDLQKLGERLAKIEKAMKRRHLLCIHQHRKRLGGGGPGQHQGIYWRGGCTGL